MPRYLSNDGATKYETFSPDWCIMKKEMEKKGQIFMRFTKIVINYTARYFLGFLAVFVCSVVVAAVAERSIRSYIVEKAETELVNGIKTTNEAIERMDLINQTVHGNRAFTTLIYSGESIPKQDVLSLKEENEVLMKTAYLSDYIPYMFILFQNNNFYLSSSQCSFDFENYYNKFLKMSVPEENIMDAAEIKEFLFFNQQQNRQFLCLESFDYMNDGLSRHLDNALLYMGKALYSGYDPQYVFCFVISSDYIKQNIVMPELIDESFLYIENIRSGEILVSDGNVPEEVKACKNRQVLGGQQEYLAIVNEANDLGWRVVTGIPVAFINAQMKSVNRLLVIYLCLGLLAAIGLTLYFSLERYLGFKKVWFTFPAEKITSSGKKRYSDYALLQDNVIQLNERGESYRFQMEELKRQNQAILMESLIVNGVRTPQESQAFTESFGTEPDFYCVAVVHPSLQDSDASEPLTVFMLRFLDMKSVSLFANVHSGVYDELFLIDLSSQRATGLTGIQEIFEEMIAGATGQFNATFHVGISAVGTGLSNINRCYEQARRIVQAQYAFENENVVKTYDLSVSMAYENPVTLEFLNHLYNLLISGQKVGIEDELEKLSGYYMRMSYLYESHKEQIFYSLRNIFYTVMLHLNYKDGEKEIPVYEQGLSCNEMVSAFLKCAEVICVYIDQGKKSKNSRLKEDILQYLDTSYQDPGLSAFIVSQKVGISEKYLYQFLKEQTGETFAALLLQVRMDKAKQYLRNTDYSNEQIAMMTGFGSVNTFYRNFKKFTGITPNIYKENCKNSMV